MSFSWGSKRGSWMSNREIGYSAFACDTETSVKFAPPYAVREMYLESKQYWCLIVGFSCARILGVCFGKIDRLQGE
jgi:hypothetical protein